MSTDNQSHKVSSIEQCHVIDLARHRHENGSLSVVENTDQYPFNVKRVFYLYDVPADTKRGGHSHHRAQELIIAAGGSFDVTLDDGKTRKTFTLNRPYRALYIPAGIWRTLENFSGSSVCLVLTSEEYSEADYVRDYSTFLDLTKDKIK
jgi:dTDP-4-dehydrorhamnose 3,5-epimerase-like enzyme